MYTPITYPIGTDITRIRDWDRSTKVWFRCKDHPEVIYYSKQPNCSAWFVIGTTIAIPDIPIQCEDCKTFITVQEYTNRPD